MEHAVATPKQRALAEADNLHLEVVRLGQAGGFDSAIPLAERVLAIREGVLGTGDPAVAAAVDSLAVLHRLRGAYDRAEPLCERALRIKEKALGPMDPDVALSLTNLALLHQARGAYMKAAPLHQRALRIREAAFGVEDVNVAETLSNLGLLYLDQGTYSEAEQLFLRAVRIGEKALPPDDPNLATLLNNLAHLYQAKGAISNAAPLYERALHMKEKALGPDHPEIAKSLNNLAGIYCSQALYDKARPLYERALRIKEKVFGVDHPEVAICLNNLAGLHHTLGAYAQARLLYERALHMSEDRLGAAHPQVVMLLNNLAGLHETLGAYAQARPLYERALRTNEEVLGAKHPHLAMSLNNLAALYQQHGLYGRAKPLFERALRIREEALGDKHPDVATSLCNLGALYRAQGLYKQATPLYERAVRITQEVFGVAHPAVAASLSNLADLYQEQDRYTQAKPLYLRVLQIREATFGKRHPEVATSLARLASLHVAQGAYARARSLHERALQIRETALGPQHPEVADSLSCLAELCRAQGAYDQAEPLALRALRIREQALGPEHPDVAMSFNNLALIDQARGAYAQAEPKYEHALHIMEHTLGAEHPHVATSLNNLAELLREQGAYAQAEPLYKRALHIRKEMLGPDHTSVATSLNNLALLYHAQGTRALAESHYAQALDILERILGASHPEVSTTLSNLAVFYRQQGAYARAKPLYERALWILEQAVGDEHPGVATSMNNLAGLHMAQGEHAQAEALYQRALHIWEKALGHDHPHVAGLLTNLAVLAWITGDISSAFRYLVRADAIQERHVGLTLMTLSEPRKRRLLHAQRGDVDLLISFHAHGDPGNTEALEAALTATLQRKARLLREVAGAQAALRGSLSPTLQGELDALQTRRVELATRRHDADPRHVDALRALAQEVERRETELSRKSAAFRAHAEPPTIAKVQAALPSGAALIEVACYRRFDPRRVQGWGESRYVAYVLRRDHAPAWLALGEAARIDTAVAAARSALTNPALDPRASLRALDELVFAPIRRLIGPTEHFVVSPDAALHLVPFAALTHERGHYLVEQCLITYLTTGRDLVRPTGPERARSRPLVLAAPHYHGRYKPLPGTLVEAAALRGYFTDLDVHVEQHATKRKLTAARGPQFVHIATHGFFRTPRPSSFVQGVRAVRRARDIIVPSVPPPPDEEGQIEEALDDAGLIFAGTTDAESDLTARELAGIDLRGTQLVVLSACDTGVGQVARSEGVYGLRRALAIAGAETQVVSLWKVDDDATSRLMSHYYGALRQGTGRSAALRRAQQELLRDGRLANPFYWAAFVVIGDDGPLRARPADPVIRRPSRDAPRSNGSTITANVYRQRDSIQSGGKLMADQMPFENVTFAENPEPRCPCVLLLDISTSMTGEPIAALNNGLVAYKDELIADGLAAKRVEIAVITFGGAVQTVCDFATAEAFQPPTLVASGETPMGQAVTTAIEMIRQRKEIYRANGIMFYRPWIFLITDGAPTDDWQSAAAAVRTGEAAKSFAFYAVGVKGADMELLRRLSVRDPLHLTGLRFRDLFQWLSNSHGRVSRSTPGDEVPLVDPTKGPKGWASV
jgi:uncharacterized protein YegL/tetratricopeptide (TPR) repeat protein